MSTREEGALPLYITVDQAVEYSGIPRDTMYQYMNSTDPPPHIVLPGKRGLRKIQTAALPAYLERKQAVRLTPARA